MGCTQVTLTGVDFDNSDVTGHTTFADRVYTANIPTLAGQYKVQPGERMQLGGGKVFVQIFDNG